MGGLFGGGGGSNTTTSAPKLSGLRIQTTVLGRCVPWVFGTARVSPNLIQYDDFTAISHKETTRTGGKGGGGGGSQTQITYTYTAALIFALCRGPIDHIGTIWVDKEKLSPAALGLDVYTGTYSQTPHAHWLTKHSEKALAYRGMAYAASQAYDLGDGGEVSSHNFEVYSSTRISNSILDANPATVIQEVITNKVDGLGLGASNIANLDTFSAFCMANSIWVSPALDEQIAAHEFITRMAEIGQSAIVPSEGKIKLIPYSDTSAAGNGATYTPNVAPVYDLTDDDFLFSDQPIKITRSSLADADNHFQVTYYNRANDYNEATAEAQDQAHIEQYGLRTKDPDDYHEICDGNVAQKLVNFKRDRSLSIRTTYEFTLSLRYCLLEPMDIVTLTYAPDGLDKVTVRITEIEENEDGDLSIKAEDCPLGTQAPTQQPAQPNLGTSVDYNIPAGMANAPVVFEPSLDMTNGQPEIWAMVSGGQNWGGAQVWASLDNATYQRIGAVTAPARQGLTTSALSNVVGIDTSSTLGVNLTMSAGELLPATQAEADAGVTLCYVDGELLSYQNAALTGVSTYNLSYLVRGLHGTTPAAHATNKQFARVDEAAFKYAYNPDWVGKTLYLKFVSYNRFGSGAQGLADVTAVPYVIKGAPMPPVQNLALAKPWTGEEVWLKWDLVKKADRYEVQVYSGSTLVRTVGTVTEGQFVYTPDMLKQDGVTGRNLVFKVRPVSITGNTSAWSQVIATNAQVGALQGILVSGSTEQAFFEYAKPTDADFAGVIIWIGTTANFTVSDTNKVYDGNDTVITLSKLTNGTKFTAGVTYYLKCAGYDTFGKDALAVSASVAFSVYSVTQMVTDLQATQLNQDLRTEIDKISGTGAGSVSARVENEATQRANADSANANAIQTVQTTVNGHTSSIQTQANSINGLSAQYTVKIDSGGKVSGYGLASTPVNGAPTSSFIVNADKFGIGSSSTGNLMPFVVDTERGVIGMSGQVLIDGTLTTNKLLVGNTSNLIPNSDFATGDATNWRLYEGADKISFVQMAGAPTKYMCRFASGAESVSMFTHVNSYDMAGADKDGIVVNAGEQYSVSIDAAKTPTLATATQIRVMAYFYKANGTFNTSVTPITLTSSVTNTWATYTGSFTVPEGAVRCWLCVFMDWSPTAGDFYWTNLTCRPMIGDALIVDGGIRARHIEANAVTADKINVTNLEAVNANTGNLKATGAIYGGGYTTAHAGNNDTWPASGVTGFALSANGLKIGNKTNNKFIRITPDGNLYAPTWSSVNGKLTINELDVINTQNLNIDSVSKSSFVSVSNKTINKAFASLASLSMSLNYSANVLVSFYGEIDSQGNFPSGYSGLFVDGIKVRNNTELSADLYLFVPSQVFYAIQLDAGTHTFDFKLDFRNGDVTYSKAILSVFAFFR